MSDYVPHSEISGNPNAPVLLCLNSLATSTRMWDAQMPALEPHFRIIRMDTRGHGQSPAPAAPYSFDQIIDDAFGTLDRYDVETAIVMGCSLGSMTALQMGLRAPDRISKIICAAARADAPQAFKENWDHRTAIINEKGVAGLWDGSQAAWMTPAFRAANPDVVETMKTEFHKTTDEGYKGCAAALKTLDVLKDLPKLAVPTLFVSGSEDKGAAPEVMAHMASVTPDSDYVMIPEAGHIINVNQPAAFTAAITAFLGV